MRSITCRCVMCQYVNMKRLLHCGRYTTVLLQHLRHIVGLDMRGTGYEEEFLVGRSSSLGVALLRHVESVGYAASHDSSSERHSIVERILFIIFYLFVMPVISIDSINTLLIG